MIRRLRRRIILINMLLIGIVIACIFVAVNINNYSNSVRTLEHGMNRLLDERSPGEFQPPDNPLNNEPKKLGKNGQADETPMEISSYIIVTIDEDGNICATQEKNVTIDTDDLKACVSLATDHSGQLWDYSLMYVTSEMKGERKIAFASNSGIWGSLQGSLFISGLLFLGGMAIIFLISLFLSGLAVKPVKKAWEQQKQFVADASHELKTPLTVILANNNIMLSHQSSTVADERQWLESTAEEATHMKNLIENMLFLAKSDAGASPMQLTEVNFSEIAEGCALNFEPVAFEREIMIDTQITPDIILQGDATQINQLTHILTDNAVKYAEAGSTVTIALRRHGDHIEFSVNNRGSVISKEDMAHLFDRFYRAEKSRTTKGYGLGLSIAQRIVENMNGKITVESSNEAGTTFTVKI